MVSRAEYDDQNRIWRSRYDCRLSEGTTTVSIERSTSVPGTSLIGFDKASRHQSTSGAVIALAVDGYLVDMGRLVVGDSGATTVERPRQWIRVNQCSAYCHPVIGFHVEQEKTTTAGPAELSS